MLKPTSHALGSSFRDPSGFVFHSSGVLYRQVNQSYRDNYDLLLGSGLYDDLVKAGLLIPHVEANRPEGATESAYRVIKPRLVGFVSYPYEWCFSQLKDAALATLAIQKRAIEYGMILKDASAYNIQFVDGKPTLIDTLSFERYREGQPWIAYKQFCQHFLGPLALMCYRDVRLGQMMRTHIDGIPLDLTSALLPRRTRLSFSLLTNIHLHARSQQRHASKPRASQRRGMSRRAMLGLVDSLESGVKRLRWQAKDTAWADYYDHTNYEAESLDHKEQLVAEYLKLTQPSVIWDLGANIGRFSRIAAELGIESIAFDLDPAAVEKNYLECLRADEKRILPLVLDLTNPSPAIGWEHSERMSLLERGPVDLVLALALIHHLAIGNNVPLESIARFIRGCCRSLIIEFVPKEDSQVKRLLASREDIFDEYSEAGFESAFAHHFSIEKETAVSGSSRKIYLMRAKS
ncbi:MAG: class I SAM-dependent methyltransferase [Candidatus Zixiibacteriota bacterium]|nr:MAG: class I SAM-dependent methyltransferase [candidate division Zixibacteria bacterium]